jgi:hypothetical protein
LIESDSLSWLSDKERTLYMSTPVRYYSKFDRAYQLPWNPHKPAVEPYTTALSKTLQRECHSISAIVRIINYTAGGEIYDTSQLIRGYLGSVGFAAAAEVQVDGVSRIDFNKSERAPTANTKP